MKLKEATKRTVESSAPGRTRKAVGISQDAMGLITSLLATFYGDRYFAVARELIANGLDACREIDAPLRVDVRTPGPLSDSQEVVFIDKGCGMTSDIFLNIFAEYGQSTKRESNQQTGAFGLGCKAPYALSDTYTVLTHRDRTTLGILSRDSEGMGQVEDYDLGDTDLHGTSITVPLAERSDIARMRDAVRQAALGAPRGTVYLDGEVLPSLEDITTKVESENIGTVYIVPKVDTDAQGPRAGLYFLQGGVLYPADNIDAVSRIDTQMRLHGPTFIAIEIPNGTARPTPQRDQFENNKANNEVLGRYVDDLQNNAGEIAALLVKDLTRFEAVKSTDRLRASLDLSNLPVVYKGQELNPTLSVANDKTYIRYNKYSSPVFKPYPYYMSRIIVSDNLDKHLIVTGAPQNAGASQKLRYFTRTWFDDKEYTEGNMLVLEEDDDLLTDEKFGWIFDLNHVTWDDINTTWKERPTSGGSSKKIAYDLTFMNDEGAIRSLVRPVDDIVDIAEGRTIVLGNVPYSHEIGELGSQYVAITRLSGNRKWSMLRKRLEDAGATVVDAADVRATFQQATIDHANSIELTPELIEGLRRRYGSRWGGMAAIKSWLGCDMDGAMNVIKEVAPTCNLVRAWQDRLRLVIDDDLTLRVSQLYATIRSLNMDARTSLVNRINERPSLLEEIKQTYPLVVSLLEAPATPSAEQVRHAVIYMDAVDLTIQ